VPLGKSLDNILDDYFGQTNVSLQPQPEDTTPETSGFNFGSAAPSSQSESVTNQSQQTKIPVSVSDEPHPILEEVNQVNSSTNQTNTAKDGTVVKEISIAAIELSPYQTRTVFEQEKIQSLALDIQDQGLIQPIIVLQKKVTSSTQPEYVLLAGERRLRAVKYLGESTILAVVKPEETLTEKQQAMLSAMENLQREDLSPIELAQTFRMLMLTQQLDEDGLAHLLGSSVQHVKNYLRLLTLAKEVRQALLDRIIGEGQARHLVPLDEAEQLTILQIIIDKDLTVKEIQELITKRQRQESPIPRTKSAGHQLPADVIHRADRFASQFPGANLKCTGSLEKGKITISWDNSNSESIRSNHQG
jgi:ParB family chromosome partitioning protein